jgi:hypothetical protein
MRLEFHEKREEDGERELKHLVSKKIYDIEYNPIIYASAIPAN